MLDLSGYDIFLWCVAIIIAAVFFWLFVMEVVDDIRFRRDRKSHDDRGKDANDIRASRGRAAEREYRDGTPRS